MSMSWKTFVQSLAGDIKPSDPRLQGLKIGFVGLLICMSGLIVFLIGLESVGKTVMYAGIAIGFVGMTTHFIVLLRRKSSED